MPQEIWLWPSEVYTTLSAMSEEAPLQGSHEFQQYLNGMHVFYLTPALYAKVY
jgi:hypothetical protein